VALRSAVEDFEYTTLAQIPGLLGRLLYLAELHDGRGRYSHWGMGKVYGEDVARRAIRAAHTAVLTQVLRTSLRELDQDLRRSASCGQITELEFLVSLEKRMAQVLPDRPAAASEKHLSAVLHALAALLQSPARASHPDALPPLPPAR
jgi:hypothetical protein